MQVIAPSHKRFAVLFFLPSCCVSADTGVKNGGSFLVTEKIEKAPNSRYPHYNTISNQQWFPKHQQTPRMAEPNSNRRLKKSSRRGTFHGSNPLNSI